MDVDDFLQEKRASEAKERLEEAKRKLREEKERLKEELRKQKESARSERFQSMSHHPDDRHQIQQVHAIGGPGLKPWMLWDLIILGLVLILFVVAMLYPRPAADAEEIQKIVNEKTTMLQNQINDLKANMTAKPAAKPTSKPKVTIAPATEEETEELETDQNSPVPLVDFTGYVEDTSGNRAGEIEANGSEVKYSLIIQNLKTDNQVCKIDRIKDGEETKNYASNVIIKAKEKDKSTYSVTEKGTTNFIYNIRCAFAEYNEESKLIPVSSYSRELEVKIKIILN
ncbi:MAG: hypothetical protein AABX86_02495 [Nanoarchaeota archaeon]